jgi:1-acyl-sn-glycerol-3-phosphate acyltransferase
MYEILIEFILRVLDIDVEIVNNCETIHPIIVSNHISELDPVLLFYVLKNENIRYIAGVEVIKNIPIFNAICEHFKVIFIERDKSKAYDAMTQQLKGTSPTVCIFPEGTLFFKSSIERSDAYCERMGIEKYKNVLAPREAGFSKLQELLGKQQCKYTDITLIYDLDMRQSETPLTILELFKLRPKHVKIIIDETDLSISDAFRKKDDCIEAHRKYCQFAKYSETRFA